MYREIDIVAVVIDKIDNTIPQLGDRVYIRKMHESERSEPVLGDFPEKTRAGGRSLYHQRLNITVEAYNVTNIIHVRYPSFHPFFVNLL